MVELWYRDGCRGESAESAVEAAGAALALSITWSSLESNDGAPLSVLELEPMSPALALAGRGRREAAAAALHFLRLSLRYPPPAAPTARAPPPKTMF